MTRCLDKETARLSASTEAGDANPSAGVYPTGETAGAVRRLYARLAAEYERMPITPHRRGGAPGDRFPL